MCRYTDHNYRTHYVCCDCLVSRKEHYHPEVRCNRCGDKMALAGKDFKAPKQRDKKTWKIIAVLVGNIPNYFNSCGCGPANPNFRLPATIEEARQKVRDHQRMKYRRTMNRIAPEIHWKKSIHKHDGFVNEVMNA